MIGRAGLRREKRNARKFESRRQLPYRSFSVIRYTNFAIAMRISISCELGRLHALAASYDNGIDRCAVALLVASVHVISLRCAVSLLSGTLKTKVALTFFSGTMHADFLNTDCFSPSFLVAFIAYITTVVQFRCESAQTSFALLSSVGSRDVASFQGSVQRVFTFTRCPVTLPRVLTVCVLASPRVVVA